MQRVKSEGGSAVFIGLDAKRPTPAVQIQSIQSWTPCTARPFAARHVAFVMPNLCQASKGKRPTCKVSKAWTLRAFSCRLFPRLDPIQAQFQFLLGFAVCFSFLRYSHDKILSKKLLFLSNINRRINNQDWINFKPIIIP